MTLYEKYLDRAEAAFAQRAAHDCPPDPQARFMLNMLTERLNALQANRADVLLPGAGRAAAFGKTCPHT